MKKIVISVCALIFVLLCTACKSSRNEEPVLPTNSGTETTEEENNVDAIEYDSREEFMTALSEMVKEYDVDEEAGEFATARLILSCEQGVDVSEFGAAEIMINPDGVYILQFASAQEAEDACAKLADVDGVNYVESDVVMSADTTSAADGEPLSWGTSAIGADVFARELGRTEYEAVTVAVVDTGVSEHEFLDGRLLEGLDILNNDGDASDDRGHGTHVAGIIVDTSPDLDIYILPIKVLDSEGKGCSSIVAEGIREATKAGAGVINLSLGGQHTNYLEAAVEEAVSQDVAVVVSAGNDACEISDYCPAHIENCITVSAVDADGQFCDFSNYGSCIDFCAPGASIYSSVPDGYEYYDGTSMAVPYISAAAAMLKASGIATTEDEIMDMLISCSMDLGEAGWDGDFGYGLPQISELVTYLDVPACYSVGVYTNSDTWDELVVHEVNDGSVSFSASWYRTAGMDGVTAEIVGETANFAWEDEFGGNYTEGYLEMLDDSTIALTLTQSGLPYIDAGTYTFEYSGTAEAYTEDIYSSVLLMNDATHIWVKDEENGKTLFFNEDGTFSYSYSYTVGDQGLMEYEQRDGMYQIEGDMIYIDGCPYSLYAYTSGVTVMELGALGVDVLGLDGSYSLCEVWVYDGSAYEDVREQYSSGQEIAEIFDASSLVGSWSCMGTNDLLYSIDNYEDGTVVISAGDPHGDMFWYCSGSWEVLSQDENTYTVYYNIYGGDPWEMENFDFSATVDATITSDGMKLELVSGAPESFDFDTLYVKPY